MYQVTGIPMNYLIDGNGIIVAKGLRGESLAAQLQPDGRLSPNITPTGELSGSWPYCQKRGTDGYFMPNCRQLVSWQKICGSAGISLKPNPHEYGKKIIQ